MPAVTGSAGTCSTVNVPAEWAAPDFEGSYATRRNGSPSALAVEASNDASAATTRSAAQFSWANTTHASGPMPAGSPDVTMIRGRYTAAPTS